MRAKFKVITVEQFEGGTEKLTMQAVCSDAPYGANGESDDNTFARFTPQGSLTMVVNNPEIVGTIKPGQKFYLDFVPTN